MNLKRLAAQIIVGAFTFGLIMAIIVFLVGILWMLYLACTEPEVARMAIWVLCGMAALVGLDKLIDWASNYMDTHPTKPS